MSTFILIAVVATLGWKPVWAAFRYLTTKKGPESKQKYRDRIKDWALALRDVVF